MYSLWRRERNDYDDDEQQDGGAAELRRRNRHRTRSRVPRGTDLPEYRQFVRSSWRDWHRQPRRRRRRRHLLPEGNDEEEFLPPPEPASPPLAPAVLAAAPGSLPADGEEWSPYLVPIAPLLAQGAQGFHHANQLAMVPFTVNLLPLGALDRLDDRNVFLPLVTRIIQHVLSAPFANGQPGAALPDLTFLTFTWNRIGGEHSWSRSFSYAPSAPGLPDDYFPDGPYATADFMARALWDWLHDEDRPASSGYDPVMWDNVHIQRVIARDIYAPAVAAAAGGIGTYNRSVEPDERARLSRCMVRILSQGNCVFHAISIGLAELYARNHPERDDLRMQYESMRHQRSSPTQGEVKVDARVLEASKRLSQLSGIPLGLVEPTAHFPRLQEAISKLYPGVQLCAVDGDAGCSITVFAPFVRDSLCLYLYLFANHCHLIVNLAAFFGRDKRVCHRCKAIFSSRLLRPHACRDLKCTHCRQFHETAATTPLTDALRDACDRCALPFRFQQCLDAHEAACDRVECKCGAIIKPPPAGMHQCGHWYCRTCRAQVPVTGNHYHCFQPTKDEKKADLTGKVGVFDIETYEHEDGILEVRLLVCRYNNELKWWWGPDACDEFLKFCLESSDMHVWVAHNFSGFDGRFLRRAAVDAGLLPRVIFRFSKIFEMEFGGNGRGRKVVFRCSARHLPMKLADLAKAFGVATQKTYFPYRLCSWRNNEVEFPALPDVEWYPTNRMDAKEYISFRTWHAAESARCTRWNLNETMLAYCINDVNCLHEVFVEKYCARKYATSKMHPAHYVTMAQMVMREWRTHYMPRWSVPIIDGSMESCGCKQEAIDWVRFTAHRLGLEVRTALQHADGRKECSMTFRDRSTLCFDGCSRDGKVVFAFLPCFENGCLFCYPFDRAAPHPTFGSLNERFASAEDRRQRVESTGMRYECIWACAWRRTREEGAVDAQRFFEQTAGEKDTEVVHARSALAGGKVFVGHMIRPLEDSEVIEVNDISSTYSHEMVTQPFPRGLPSVLRNPSVSEYLRLQLFGTISCRILPPQRLRHPVLWSRFGGRLVFPLCSACAREAFRESDEERGGGGVEIVDEADWRDCRHTALERSLKGNWVTPLVNYALEHGYKLLEIDEVRYFRRTSTETFSSFVFDRFAKKLYAEGIGGDAKLVEEVVRQNKERFPDMELDSTKFAAERDPCARTENKLELNCPTGKFGQKTSFTEYHFIATRDQLKKLVQANHHGATIDLKESYARSHLFSVERNRDIDAPGNMTRHIYFAALITAYAQIRLHRLQMEAATKYTRTACAGSRVSLCPVFYCDTDSIAYVRRRTEPGLACDWTLGGLKREALCGRFVVVSNKFYGHDHDGDQEDYWDDAAAAIRRRPKITIKAKGLSQNRSTTAVLSLDGLERLVLSPAEEVKLPNLVVREHSTRMEVSMFEQMKRYTRAYRKSGVVRLPNGHITCLPFGYCIY